MVTSSSLSPSVVPRLLVPLTPPSCMCESLRDLALNARHSVFVPSCATNEACNGVRCRVSTFGTTFYIEGVILPCDTAVDLVVENSNLEPIFDTVFNESGQRILDVSGFLITVNATIIPHEYSMDIEVG